MFLSYAYISPDGLRLSTVTKEGPGTQHRHPREETSFKNKRRRETWAIGRMPCLAGWQPERSRES
jgi:hypothetical protein